MSNRPPTDPNSFSGRSAERTALEIIRLYARLVWLLFRLATVPLWAPFFMVGGVKERRRIRAFIIERSAGQPITNGLIRDLTITWAEQNPRRYPHGRHDPRFDRLRRRFESVAQLIQQRRGY